MQLGIFVLIKLIHYLHQKEDIRMKERFLRVYKRTISIVNETPIAIYETLCKGKCGFLLESYDKDYDRFTFIGVEPEEIIQSKDNSLVITKSNGDVQVYEGNPMELLKQYCNCHHVVKDECELAFSGGIVGSAGY